MPVTDKEHDDAYRAFMVARAKGVGEFDAIRAAFPRRRAGDVRYTTDAHGEPGTPLRAAYDAYVEARDRWDALRAEAMAELHKGLRQ